MSDNWLADLKENEKRKAGLSGSFPRSVFRGPGERTGKLRTDRDKALDEALERALEIKKEEG